MAVPSARSPQLWIPPVEIWVKMAAAGADSP